MPNIVTDLDFERQIADFTPSERFLARQIRGIEKNCPMCADASSRQKRQAIGIGSLSGIMGGAIVFAIKYLTGQQK